VRPSRLGFFVELDEREFVDLLRRNDVRDALCRLGAGITVGLRDLGAERARVIREVQALGVPVGAWLLLPEPEGYFATCDNADAVARRVEALQAWSSHHGLAFDALGFDFEPDLAELRAFFGAPASTLAHWARRARSLERWARARATYQAMVDRLRCDGWTIEAYQVPVLLEDRAAGGTWLQRLVGALDVRVDREVVMAYSSLLGPFGHGLLARWAPGARAIAVGSTGGGIDPLPKLGWEAFERDLLLAAATCDDVRIFSLEGCVARGFLSRLVDFDWQRVVRVSGLQRGAAWLAGSAARALSWAARLESALWSSDAARR
jgi:hypothetical protein